MPFLGPEEVNYAELERNIPKKRFERVYAGSHPYQRFRSLSQWLRDGELSLVSALALASAKDFETAKESYDTFISAGLSPVAAYVLASSSHPGRAYERYQVLIHSGVNGAEAYLKAVSSEEASGLEEAKPRWIAAEMVVERFRDQTRLALGGMLDILSESGSKGVILDARIPPGVLVIAVMLQKVKIPVVVVEADVREREITARLLTGVPVAESFEQAVKILAARQITEPILLTQAVTPSAKEVLIYLQDRRLLPLGDLKPFLAVSLDESRYREQIAQYL